MSLPVFYFMANVRPCEFQRRAAALYSTSISRRNQACRLLQFSFPYPFPPTRSCRLLSGISQAGAAVREQILWLQVIRGGRSLLAPPGDVRANRPKLAPREIIAEKEFSGSSSTSTASAEEGDRSLEHRGWYAFFTIDDDFKRSDWRIGPRVG